MIHAFFECPANSGLPARLLALLEGHQQGLNPAQVLTLNLDIDPNVELSLVWITITVLTSLWKQRKEGRVEEAQTRAELEARCRILREG